MRGLTDDARAGKADHGFWLRDNDVAERGVAGHDTRRGGVCENRDVGKFGLSVECEGATGFCHLHQAQHALIHTGATGGTYKNDGHFLLGGKLNNAGDFFANDRSHCCSEKVKIHDPETEGMAVDFCAAGGDCVHKAGFLFIAPEAVGVGRHALEPERIDRRHRGVVFLERIGINEARNALAGAEVEVVAAFRADLQIFLEGEVVDDLRAGRALGPEPGRHFTGLAGEGAKDGFFEDGHGFEKVIRGRP